MRTLSPRLMLLVLGLLCAGSVGLALLAQHRFGMQPCPWCILQRILFIVLSVLALVGAALPGNLGRRVLSALSLPLALGGIAAALWQHFVAAKTSSCALTFADRVNSYFGWTPAGPNGSRCAPTAPMPPSACSVCPSSSGRWPCLPWPPSCCRSAS
jgi:disulfide bond formation protein DsbB